MGEFAMWLREAEPKPATAFDAREGLVTIHPFSDGNRRTAHLLMNLLLLKTGCPPLVILPEDRVAYHDALKPVQLRGEREAWHGFMFARLDTALDHYLQILRRGLTS